jgi:hypothetical protein
MNDLVGLRVRTVIIDFRLKPGNDNTESGARPGITIAMIGKRNREHSL